MPGIPQRRDPHDNAEHPSRIVGRRASEVRRLRGPSQEEIADRMADLGHANWHRQTVGQVEGAKRNVTVDELVSLAAALQTTVAFLLSPIPLDPNQSPSKVDVGADDALDADDVQLVYGFALPERGRETAADGYFEWPSTKLFHAQADFDRLLRDMPSGPLSPRRLYGYAIRHGFDEDTAWAFADEMFQEWLAGGPQPPRTHTLTGRPFREDEAENTIEFDDPESDEELPEAKPFNQGGDE